MKKVMSTIRYFLIAPAAVLSWLAIFFLGIFAEISVRRYFCPTAYQRGQHSSCSVSYADEVSTGIMLFFIALSALTVVGTAIFIAPSHKFRCGLVTYCIGAVIATFLAVEFGLSAWLSALAAGLLPLLALKRQNERDKGVST